MISAYINFCVDLNIPRKTSKVFQNNKPWVSKELRDLLKAKNRALVAGDNSEVRNLQKQIKRQVITSKQLYKEKIERGFQENNPKAAWKTLQDVTGYKRKSSVNESVVNQTFVDSLNDFYCRFDHSDFARKNVETMQNLRESLTRDFEVITVSEHEVRMVLGDVNVNKTPGPDRICNKVLNTCKDQLASVFQKLFQLSIEEQFLNCGKCQLLYRFLK